MKDKFEFYGGKRIVEKIYLIMALLLNLAIVVIEIIVLFKVIEKKNILKFYTFLSNLIGLVASVVFVCVGFNVLLTNGIIPIWVKGLRFSATHSLASTLLVFAIILLPLYKKGTLSNEIELFKGISEAKANVILHYLCPLLSIISFLLFERNPVLEDSQWTLYAALPSIIYWSLYLVLTITHCWKEPYGFTEKKEAQKTDVKGSILLLLIPILSVGLDYLLWWINIL